MKKLLFVILLVAGGYFAHNEGWLDGTPLSLHPAMELDFSSLTSQTKEPWVLENYPNLDWDCYNEKTRMGDRVCTAPIRRWNKILAKYTAFFFNQRGNLNLVKLTFREPEHPKLVDTLNAEYGQPRKSPNKKDIYGQPIVIWMAGKGFVAASENVKDTGETTMTWVSGRAVSGRYSEMSGK